MVHKHDSLSSPPASLLSLPLLSKNLNICANNTSSQISSYHIFMQVSSVSIIMFIFWGLLHLQKTEISISPHPLLEKYIQICSKICKINFFIEILHKYMKMQYRQWCCRHVSSAQIHSLSLCSFLSPSPSPSLSSPHLSSFTFNDTGLLSGGLSFHGRTPRNSNLGLSSP